MPPPSRFASSYTPAVLPRLSILQLWDEELDSESESKAEAEKVEAAGHAAYEGTSQAAGVSVQVELVEQPRRAPGQELTVGEQILIPQNIESEKDEDSYSDSESDCGFPANLPDKDDRLDFITFANDDDDDGSDHNTEDDNIDEEAVPEEVCGKLTKRLVTAIHQTQYAANDVEGERPFTCSDFVAQALYITRACRMLHDDVMVLGHRYLDAESTLDEKNPLAAGEGGSKPIRRLVTLLDINIRRLALLLPDLEEEIGSCEYPGFVHAISLRTVRLWCMLNTKDVREKILGLDRSAFRPFIESLATMIDVDSFTGGLHPKNTRKILKRYGNVHSVIPQVYSICLGNNSNKDDRACPVHLFSHAGDTKERLGSWPEFHRIRLAARNAHIGAQQVEAWLGYHQDLQSLEEQAEKAGLEQSMVRVAFSRFALKGIPIPEMISALPAWNKLVKPLRDVSQHVGGAFLEKGGKILIIGCCYGCKASIRFDEAMSAEEFEENIAYQAREFKLGVRLQDAHSCAEHLIAELTAYSLLCSGFGWENLFW
ncbi:hypothetical protein FPHYL_6306 [Fusarium phyllophilum]|uniref:Uncharacterized protein n=1 Tax=Fusarium phyllophilum TaxID=47803 RepID=A0A8H5JUU6_9HYPO|nr:hypothetical protein FPHYL_6306 [Fusarium phyllophilum]